ncbi:hypothetical protein [Microbacterium suwonense]|uniref:hypothetical protein n=1 Tax=Microbacterium suwonense TaxID=683047 RepID=UPI002572C68F|nr:hypothetical protein [Microbacterium suwonense]
MIARRALGILLLPPPGLILLLPGSVLRTPGLQRGSVGGGGAEGREDAGIAPSAAASSSRVSASTAAPE